MKETHSIVHVITLSCMPHLQMRIKRHLLLRNQFLANKMNHKLHQCLKHSSFLTDKLLSKMLVNWFITQDFFINFHSLQNQTAPQFYCCNIQFKYCQICWKNAKILRSSIITTVQQENQSKSETLSRQINVH